MMKVEISKRSFGNWFNSLLPLTSKRVQIILSNPGDSRKLVNLIRSTRKGHPEPFRLSDEVSRKIEEASKNIA